MNVRVNFRGVDFYIDECNKYPYWAGASEPRIADPAAKCWQVTRTMCVGVRYGDNWLRKRVLAEARKLHPHIPDDASIVFAIRVGFRYNLIGDGDGVRTGSVTCPELFFLLGGKRAVWKPYKTPGKHRLQKMLDACTFGINWEHRIEECFEKHQVDNSSDLHIDNFEEDLDDYLSKIIGALADPPTTAPAFPAPFQSYVIERNKRDYYEADEFDFIVGEAMECLAALGLEPEHKSVTWETYPARFACRLQETSLSTVLRTAMDDKLDAFVEDNRHYAPIVEKYRKDLLTPQTMLYMCVPLYSTAFENVDIEMRPSGRSNTMKYSWEAAYDFDEAIENAAPNSDTSSTQDALDYVMDCVEDAVDNVMAHYAGALEEHYDYLSSEVGVWESVEGCGDFDDCFAEFINRY